MYKIEHMGIKNLWSTKDLEISFNPDINIFIGKNGSGKTTLIRSLKSVLTCDLMDLLDLNFSEISIKLKEGRKKRTIKVIKDTEGETLKYKISKETFYIPLIPLYELKEVRYETARIYRRHSRFYPMQSIVENIQMKLQKLVDIKWVSVSREIRDIGPIEELGSRRGVINIDRIVDGLLGELRDYLLSIQSKIGEKYKEFEKFVVISMLFDKEFDSKLKFGVTKDKDALSDKRIKLTNAFKGLKIYDRHVEKKIENHFKKYSEAITRLQEIEMHPERTKDKGYTITDFTVLPLMARTEKMVEKASEIDEYKKKLMSGIDEYLNLLNRFMDDKIIKLNPDGELVIRLKKSRENIDIRNLSSGEKQLLILFTEAVIQGKAKSIYIADEPELSLHIEWQENLLKSISILSPNSQIIVATHSPDIISNFSDKVFQMGEIVHDSTISSHR